jgi:hypothetical protein
MNIGIIIVNVSAFWISLWWLVDAFKKNRRIGIIGWTISVILQVVAVLIQLHGGSL